MNNINITTKDIVNCMTDDMKHKLALDCILNETQPEDVIKLIANVANSTVNFAIDLCNDYFSTPAGKEYLNMRSKIDKLGE